MLPVLPCTYLGTWLTPALKPVDSPLLARLAIAFAIGEKAIRELRANGYTIKSSTGTLLPSLWLAAFNRSTETARKLSSELGLPILLALG